MKRTKRQPRTTERPARKSEQLLIELAADVTAERVLCTSLGRAQFACDFAARNPLAQVHCLFLDLSQAHWAQEAASRSGHAPQILCQSDFPDGECDLVALPLTAGGNAELTRDLLQSAFDRLTIGSPLIATTDNPSDSWLHGELRKLSTKLSRHVTKAGVGYRLIKTAPLKKHKNFRAAFAFRDGERLIHAVSRPGVFSHRHLDVGARALIEALEVQPGDRVLDLGCGSGVVSFAAALRAPEVSVLAVDANPRAVECTREGAVLNGITQLTAQLSADAIADVAGQFDRVLANPPYYSHFRIGELFLRGAEQALRPGGVLQLVTKQPDEYLARLPAGFHRSTSTPVRQYWVIRAIRKPSRP